VGTIARIKTGDYGSALRVDLYYRDDDYDITDTVSLATDVVFIMTPQGVTDTPPTIDRGTASVVNVDTDLKVVTVNYQWQSGDTDLPGVYDAEFEFDLPGGPSTAPTHNYLTVVVQDDLG
jgi:hypothetical protein